MKKAHLLLHTLLIMALCSSCGDTESINTNTVTPPTAQQFAALKTAAYNNIKQEFTINASDATSTFISAQGVTVTLNGSCLTKNGAPVTGNVTIEYAEIFNRGNMLVTNRPTMGVMDNGDKALLISGGEFYINATQGGVQLASNCGYQLQIPGALTGGSDPAMTLWKSATDENGDEAWEQDNPDDGQEEGVFAANTANGDYYYGFLQAFGWTNVDRFYSDPRPKTTIEVAVPDGFTNTNSAVYISYNEEGNALAQLDTYDDATGLFSEHYGQIPIGLECNVIFVSESDGNWIYAIKAVTITENGVITFTDADLATVTEAQLIALINALP